MYQGTIDWDRVKASGVEGAWIKIGGADGTRSPYYRDPNATANLIGANAAGMPVGTYYWLDTRRSPEEQARHAVDIGHGAGLLWPMNDLENNPAHLDQWHMDDFLGRFCAQVEVLNHREQIWYGGYGSNVGFTERCPQCPAWISNYGPNRPGTTPPYLTGSYSDGKGGPKVPPRFGKWSVWQFNSVTNVPGIPGNVVDQNVVDDAFWQLMMTGKKEEAMAQCVILSTKVGSKWGKEVAGYGVDGQAEYMAYPGSGILVWIPSPEVLHTYESLGVEHRFDVNDDVFYTFTLQPHDGRAPKSPTS
jgi:GH25 family lysozyme M1 (1,4-beta-N-acetylmuramidase)